MSHPSPSPLSSLPSPFIGTRMVEFKHIPNAEKTAAVVHNRRRAVYTQQPRLFIKPRYDMTLKHELHLVEVRNDDDENKCRPRAPSGYIGTDRSSTELKLTFTTNFPFRLPPLSGSRVTHTLSVCLPRVRRLCWGKTWTRSTTLTRLCRTLPSR